MGSRPAPTMVLDRTFSPALAAVTVGLLDGTDPQRPFREVFSVRADLTLTLPTGPAPKATLAAERVAYVGFHRARTIRRRRRTNDGAR